MTSASWYSQSVEIDPNPKIKILDIKELLIKFEIIGVNFA